MYFSNFPKTLYQISPPSLREEPKYVLMTDITRNYRFIRSVMSNIVAYDEYIIKDGETPEILAEKLYDSPYYHWVLMLFNDRYDYRKDFPIPSTYFDAYIEDKYGSVDHAKNLIIDVVDNRGISTQLDVGPSKSIYTIDSGTGIQVLSFVDKTTGVITAAPDFGAIDYATPVYAYDAENIMNENKRKFKLINRPTLDTVLSNFVSLR